MITSPISCSASSKNQPTQPGGAGSVISVLFSSNANWAQRVTDLYPNYFLANARRDKPQVLWIGCSDARAPETLITDSPPGRIFVHRTIANQFPATDISAQSVLEYAVNTLAVKHVVVVGHTNCSGVEIAYDNAQSGKPPLDTPLEKWLTPLTRRITGLSILVDTPRDEAILIATKENIEMQVKTIRGQIGPDSAVTVHGWLYNLEKGLFEDLLDSETGI